MFLILEKKELGLNHRSWEDTIMLTKHNGLNDFIKMKQIIPLLALHDSNVTVIIT